MMKDVGVTYCVSDKRLLLFHSQGMQLSYLLGGLSIVIAPLARLRVCWIAGKLALEDALCVLVRTSI